MCLKTVPDMQTMCALVRLNHVMKHGVLYTHTLYQTSLHGVSVEETSGCGLSNRNAGGSVALWGSVTDNVLRHLCALETSLRHAL